MSCFSIKNIRKSIILALAIIMSITVVGCNKKYIPKEERKLTDEEIKQDIILPLLASGLCSYSWDNCEEQEVYHLAGYAMYKLQEKYPVEQYKNNHCSYDIPKDMFENEVKKYFNADITFFRNWMRYDEDKNVYYCSDTLDNKRSEDIIKIKGVSKEKGNKVIDFDIKCSYDFVISCELTVDDKGDDIKLLSLKVTDKDYYSLCVGMNITFVDYEFEKPTDLNSQQLFKYAMYTIYSENIGRENFDRWFAQNPDEKSEGVPLSVVEDVLKSHLGEYNFNPEEIDCYDKENKVFLHFYGGYGGVRSHKLREKTMEGDILTLAIDYYTMPFEEDEEEEIYQTIYTKFKINDDYSYKLLSIKKKNYD